MVHPRTAIENWRQLFPILRGLTARFAGLFPPTASIVLSPIEVPVGDRLLRGELVMIPHSPEEMLDRLPEARDAVVQILDYAEYRETKMVGLGALIPSLTRHGRVLRQAKPGVSITTGHGFTALTIAQMVDDIEAEIGSGGVVAVIGAAGSTGRAALRCMFRRAPSRQILAVDVALSSGITVFGLTGESGGELATKCESIKIPSARTERIQEGHILVGHVLCSLIEDGYFKKS